MRQPEYFKTWLIRILLNNIHDYFRKKREFAGTEAVENSFAMQENPTGDGITAEERMDLSNAIDALPEKYKSIIILKYYEDLKISEIASMLNIPEGSVKAYLHNAKETLRAYLKEDYLYE